MWEQPAHMTEAAYISKTSKSLHLISTGEERPLSMNVFLRYSEKTQTVWN